MGLVSTIININNILGDKTIPKNYPHCQGYFFGPNGAPHFETYPYIIIIIIINGTMFITNMVIPSDGIVCNLFEQ
jgi:hypothetical protein